MVDKHLKRAAPQLVEQRGAGPSLVKRDRHIISEFERGSHYAAIAFAAMCAFLSIGVILWQW